MLLLGVVIVQPVQSYVFILTSINCLNIKCKFCRKEKRDLTMRILKSMEIQFLRILPKVQKNASQHHPNLCDIPCAMFFCDTPGSLSFSISSQTSHICQCQNVSNRFRSKNWRENGKRLSCRC